MGRIARNVARGEQIVPLDAWDRARLCDGVFARPPFALERLRELDGEHPRDTQAPELVDAPLVNACVFVLVCVELDFR